MADYHVVLGIIAVVFGIVGYAIYIRSILRGATKPHIFTWLIYAVVDAIVFTAQAVSGSGPGSWVLLLGVVGNTAIVLLSLRRGEKNIRAVDWMFFATALFGIFLWRVTDDPLGAVIVLTIANALAIVPTLRKSYVNPFEESISIWSLDIARFGVSLFALSVFTVTTALFPVGVVVANSLLVSMILLRRRKLGRLF